MTHASDTLREIEELPDLGITLADGYRLSARVWRPVDAANIREWRKTEPPRTAV